MEFYGILGQKLKHTISPMIHHKIFSLLNVEGAYKVFEVEHKDLSKVADSFKLLKIRGANVTIPYKEDIMQYLDFISPEAEKIRAVNTIFLKDEKLYGYNTDYFGFGKMLSKNEIEIKDKIAMVLGTGGASKAVITYLIDQGIKKIYLVSRNKKVDNQYDKNIVEYTTYEEIGEVKGNILINTTPVGMYPNVGVSSVDDKIINNFDTLVDLIYNPQETEFIKIGKELNKKVCSGLLMLIYQAVKAEEIWQDISMDEVLNEELCSFINKQFR